MYSVIVSRTFQKQFHSLQEQLQQRIRNALKELEIDPDKSRSEADIKLLKSTKLQKHRMRVGDYRIIYMIEENTVYVIEVFKRSQGY
ncbi:MAG: type II toxin-antitoxin system RelE/ParE family toxin [Methanosarcinaceae archaeon]|nr:type II toxin-antitoxin system RelE/ParE family toxin [Methanosarcinaceae archaeon]MDF1534154.1 type II toxin-antitoxin system RelE/ParE family toxin [Methanosarcinaceae archaeon]